MWYKEWILSLAAIACFCSLIGFIIPYKGKREIELILSLIVIMVVITPIIKFFGKLDELNMEVSETKENIEIQEDYFRTQVLMITENKIKKDIEDTFLSFCGHKPKDVEILLIIEDNNSVVLEGITITRGNETPSPNESKMKQDIYERYKAEHITVK
jgi:hypothetical protein